MTPKNDLVRANNDNEARTALQENPDFDVIPLLDGQREIHAYFERENQKVRSFERGDIISDNTSILSLVSILRSRSRKFCFILADDKIAGYVHYSDLNKGIVKLPYFLLFQDLERRLVDRFGDRIQEESLKKVLAPKKVDQLKDRMAKRKKKRSELRWVNVLTFSEILEFAKWFDAVKLEGSQIEVLSAIRNRVCHATRSLVEAPKDLKNLDEAKCICLSLFEEQLA